MGRHALADVPVCGLPSLRGAIVTGALLTFARSIGEFGSTIMVSGNKALKTQTAPLYIYAKFNEGDVEGANAIAAVLAILSFAIFHLSSSPKNDWKNDANAECGLWNPGQQKFRNRTKRGCAMAQVMFDRIITD